MSLLSELTALLSSLGLTVETGVFTGEAPDEYAVVTPLADMFDVYADNLPRIERQEARISLFSKWNYTARVRQVTEALFCTDFAITERRYIGYENDTGYHNYSVDAAKAYSFREGGI
jgi:hypothetical protein